MTNERRAFLALMAAGATMAAANAKGARWPNQERRTGKYSDRFPNIALRTHDDVAVRFYDDLLKDRVVIVNFMYSACSERCPMVTANLRQLHKALGMRMGRDILMLSISLTPEIDQPKTLREYAARFGGTGPGWLYLTGERRDIEKLRRSMGVFERDPVLDADATIHAGLLTIGNDQTSQWRRMPALLEPRDLTDAIMRIAPRPSYRLT
ncbi:MAG: SCO family protein [Burkholderiales bacterium]|jgi:protein SCO1/2